MVFSGFLVVFTKNTDDTPVATDVGTRSFSGYNDFLLNRNNYVFNEKYSEIYKKHSPYNRQRIQHVYPLIPIIDPVYNEPKMKSFSTYGGGFSGSGSGLTSSTASSSANIKKYKPLVYVKNNKFINIKKRAIQVQSDYSIIYDFLKTMLYFINSINDTKIKSAFELLNDGVIAQVLRSCVETEVIFHNENVISQFFSCYIKKNSNSIKNLTTLNASLQSSISFFYPVVNISVDVFQPSKLCLYGDIYWLNTLTLTNNRSNNYTDYITCNVQMSTKNSSSTLFNVVDIFDKGSLGYLDCFFGSVTFYVIFNVPISTIYDNDNKFFINVGVRESGMYNTQSIEYTTYFKISI